MSDPAHSFSDADADRTEVGAPGALGQTVPHGYGPDSQVGAGDPKFAPPREAGELGRVGHGGFEAGELGFADAQGAKGS